MLENYTFVACNNPSNTRRDGVGLFYKNDLPLKIRMDLAFDESIVAELIFGRKKIFFTALYRRLSCTHGSQEFFKFLIELKTLYESLKKENTYCIFVSGDFNGHSKLWWKNGDTNAEGNEIEQLTSWLGLNQLIQEPIHFEPHRNPSCIDLIFTQTIEKAKANYLTQVGHEIANNQIGQKTYWKLVNRIMNKCKAPKIPPILFDNKFITDCKDKATIFARFFTQQCQALFHGSTLPPFSHLTHSRFDHVTIASEEITSLIRSLNKGKASGPDK